MVKRYDHLRRLIYIIEIIVLFVLEQTPFLMPKVMGEKPILLIPVLICIAMFENEFVAMGFGIFIGLLMDMGIGRIFGFNTILLAIVGYVIGLLCTNLIKINFLTASIMSVILISFLISIQFVFLNFIFWPQDAVYTYVYHYLPRMIYTFVVVPIVYYLNLGIVLLLRQKD